MKAPLHWMAVCALLAVAPLKGGVFSEHLSRDEFKAAGLDKLTPEELAKLDALVSGQHSAEIAKVREETTTKIRNETEAKVKAELTATKPAQPESFLHRMRVVLTPGTEISYSTIESELVGKYRGYEPGTILTLANGQKWRVLQGNYWVPPRDQDKPRKVKIVPGTLGSFFIEIENGGRTKVKIVSDGD